MSLIRKPAPGFVAPAWYNGDFVDIDIKSYHGKYVVLFFYPLDFTFVCPTEIIAFNKTDLLQEDEIEVGLGRELPPPESAERERDEPAARDFAVARGEFGDRGAGEQCDRSFGHQREFAAGIGRADRAVEQLDAKRKAALGGPDADAIEQLFALEVAADTVEFG